MARTKAQWDKILMDASDVALHFAGAEFPDMSNKSNGQLIDELGALNAAKNYIEKAEKAMKEVIKGKIRGGDLKKQESGEKFAYSIALQERTALNQTAAKAKLLELGGEAVLAECMSTTEVETMRFSDV